MRAPMVIKVGLLVLVGVAGIYAGMNYLVAGESVAPVSAPSSLVEKASVFHSEFSKDYDGLVKLTKTPLWVPEVLPDGFTLIEHGSGSVLHSTALGHVLMYGPDSSEDLGPWGRGKITLQVAKSTGESLSVLEAYGGGFPMSDIETLDIAVHGKTGQIAVGEQTDVDGIPRSLIYAYVDLGDVHLRALGEGVSRDEVKQILQSTRLWVADVEQATDVDDSP